jgi:hypothetical protein
MALGALKDLKDVGDELWFSNVILRNFSPHSVVFNISKDSSQEGGLCIILQPDETLFIYLRQVENIKSGEFKKKDMVDVYYRLQGRKFIHEPEISVTITYRGPQSVPSAIEYIISSTPRLLRFKGYIPITGADIYSFIMPFKAEDGIYITVIENDNISN